MQIRWTDSGLVFTTEFGGPVVPRNLLRAVELAAANAGIRTSACTPCGAVPRWPGLRLAHTSKRPLICGIQQHRHHRRLLRPHVTRLRELLSTARPIPDDTWTAARQVLRDHAAELGATQEHVYADKPGHHDIAIYADNGVELHLIARGQAVLNAMSDCYLQRADL